MKVFKRYGSAIKVNQPRKPMLRISGLGGKGFYVIDIDSLTEACLIDVKGRVVGNITMEHLNRLGNANWAESGDARMHTLIDWENPNAD